LIGGALGGYSGYAGATASFEATESINMATELAKEGNWQANVLLANAEGLAQAGHNAAAARQLGNAATAAGGSSTALGQYIGNIGSQFSSQLAQGVTPSLGAINSLSSNALISGGYAGQDAATAFNNANDLGQAGRLSASSEQLSRVPDLVNTYGATGNYLPSTITPNSLNQLNAVSNVISPSMEAVTDNLALGLGSQMTGSTLTKAAVLSWGWEPEEAQFLGMVGASTYSYTGAANMDAGKEMMHDMYKDTHEGWAEPFAKDAVNKDGLPFTDWDRMKVGAVTGLGLGSIQAGINIAIDKELATRDNVPDSARQQIASLGGQALGTIAWSGIAGGLGAIEGTSEIKTVPTEQTQIELQTQSYGFDQGNAPIIEGERDVWQAGLGDQEMSFSYTDEGFQDASAYNKHLKTQSQTAGWRLPVRPETEAYQEIDFSRANEIADVWLTPPEQKVVTKQVTVPVMQTVTNKGSFLKGVGKGIDSVINDEQFKRSVLRQGMSIGLGWAAEKNADSLGIKPEQAGLVGSSGAMLLSNLPIWPSPPNHNEAAKLRGDAGELSDLNTKWREENAAQLEDDNRSALAEKVRGDIEYNEIQIDKFNDRADKVSGWHWDTLRTPTVITDNETLDAVLEPVTYAAVALAVDDLRENKLDEPDLATHDLATMQVAQMAHSGLTVLFNKQGLDEFGQIQRWKNSEFQDGLLSFGTQAFATSKYRTEEESLVGRSNIYGATQRNSQLWNFSGLSSYNVNADRVENQGGNWRLQMGQSATGPFAAYASSISNPSGGLARYHAIRNTEASLYTAAKNTITPYTVERISPYMNARLRIQDQTGLDQVNRWLKESPYPVSLAGEGLQLPGWIIGDDKQGVLTLENTATGAKYPLTPETSEQVLTDLNVNRPYDVIPAGGFTQPQQPFDPNLQEAQQPELETFTKEEIVDQLEYPVD
jgi:hypothetical protein